MDYGKRKLTTDDYIFIAYVIKALDRTRRRYLDRLSRVEQNEVLDSDMNYQFPESYKHESVHINFDENLPITDQIEDKRLKDIIESLEENEKKIFYLKVLEDMTFAQISEATGFSISSIKKTFYAALTKIRTALGRL